jgi:hypothetical protein
MTRLDFAMAPSFQCFDDDAADMAFVKATHMIGGRDVVRSICHAGLSPYRRASPWVRLVEADYALVAVPHCQTPRGDE